MKRAPVVLLGTAAGLGGIMAFHTHKPASTIAIHPATASPTTATPATTAPPATAGGGSSPASTSPTTAPSAGSGPRRATSSVEPYPYGQLSVTVTKTGGQITDVEMASLSETDPRSVMIDDQAIPQLRSQVLSANSANIQGVSGATFTSQAYAQAVQSALDQLPSS